MKAVSLLLLLATQAQAAIIGVVPLTNGATLRLHDTAGPCIHGALLVEYVAPGKPTIPGCWIVRGPVVSAVFLDGDSGEIPIQAIQKPVSL